MRALRESSLSLVFGAMRLLTLLGQSPESKPVGALHQWTGESN
jgi:hypothetical protein